MIESSLVFFFFVSFFSNLEYISLATALWRRGRHIDAPLYCVLGLMTYRTTWIKIWFHFLSCVYTEGS